jgi:4-hydroxybenzoate polyprenyltransferase
MDPKDPPSRRPPSPPRTKGAAEPGVRAPAGGAPRPSAKLPAPNAAKSAAKPTAKAATAVAKANPRRAPESGAARDPAAAKKGAAPARAAAKPVASAKPTTPRAAPRRAVVAAPALRWPAFVPPRVRERLREYALLTRQDRPIGWLLLLWPTWWGLWLAAEGFPPWGTLAIFTLGVVVMRSAGCAINDYADRWLDPQVQRTRERPVAAGRVSPREALAVFGVLILIALGLVLLTNTRTIALAGVAAVLAVVYPFLKRHTYVPQLWLGAAFGMSIPMAFSAVTDAWPPPLAWLAFAANILWATAYDTYYAMVDREDDLRAGAKSTAILFGELDLVAIGVVQGCFLLAMALLGARAELGGWYHAGLALALAISAWQLWRARGRDRAGCFAAFRASHLAGLALFLGIAAHYALG